MSISSVSSIAAASLAKQAQSQTQLAQTAAAAQPTTGTEPPAPPHHHHHGGGERTPAQTATQAPTETAHGAGGINTLA
jgi:hypothetical protein